MNRCDVCDHPTVAILQRHLRRTLWDDAVRYLQKLTALRREYGRAGEPFEIMLALLEAPSADLYRRAEDLGIAAVMCAPWMGENVEPGDQERCRAAIERFAETVIARCR